MNTYVPVVDVLIHVGASPKSKGEVFASLRRVYPKATVESIKWAMCKAVYEGHLVQVGDTLYPA